MGLCISCSESVTCRRDPHLSGKTKGNKWLFKSNFLGSEINASLENPMAVTKRGCFSLLKHSMLLFPSRPLSVHCFHKSSAWLKWHFWACVRLCVKYYPKEETFAIFVGVANTITSLTSFCTLMGTQIIPRAPDLDALNIIIIMQPHLWAQI